VVGEKTSGLRFLTMSNEISHRSKEKKKGLRALTLSLKSPLKRNKKSRKTAKASKHKAPLDHNLNRSKMKKRERKDARTCRQTRYKGENKGGFLAAVVESQRKSSRRRKGPGSGSRSGSTAQTGPPRGRSACQEERNSALSEAHHPREEKRARSQ